MGPVSTGGRVEPNRPAARYSARRRRGKGRLTGAPPRQRVSGIMGRDGHKPAAQSLAESPCRRQEPLARRVSGVSAYANATPPISR
jgi:hypothetical protein